MCSDRLLAKPVRQLARNAFGHAPRVDEDKSGPMRLDQLAKAVVDLLPGLGRHHGLQRRVGHLERQIAWTLMAGVDDGGCSCASGAYQQAGDLTDRVLRRGQTDAYQ